MPRRSALLLAALLLLTPAVLNSQLSAQESSEPAHSRSTRRSAAMPNTRSVARQEIAPNEAHSGAAQPAATALVVPHNDLRQVSTVPKDSQLAAGRAIHWSLSDADTISPSDTLTQSHTPHVLPPGSADELKDSLSGHDHGSEAEAEAEKVYPRCVSHDPGWPQKPVHDRPGDINWGDCPPPRYLQNNYFRAGWPLSIRPRAICSINPRYAAGYVGGGAFLGLPHARPRTCEEGTWGLDYTIWSKPATVFMRWTNGCEQGGLGAYETDH